MDTIDGRQRALSQLALALRVETTTRHLSYVENGRSRPGRELVLRLADTLELPLRSRDDFAPGPSRELLTNFAEVAWSFRSRLSRAPPSTRELGAMEKRMPGYLAGVPRPVLDASGEPVICRPAASEARASARSA